MQRNGCRAGSAWCAPPMGVTLGKGGLPRDRRVAFAEAENSRNRAALLPSGRQLLQDRDRAVLDGEVAACDEVLHEPADHVARRADALGDVLLREPLGDDGSAVDLLR